MSTTRKPRRDSRLKTLPEETQAAIAQLYLKEGNSAPSLVATHFGIKTSVTALSEFYSWWQLQQSFKQDAQTVEFLLGTLKQERPDISAAEEYEMGQRLFTRMAISKQDDESWSRLQQIAIKKADQDLAREKFQRDTTEMFLRWFADKKAAEIASSSQSNDEKIQRLGQLMFGGDWK